MSENQLVAEAVALPDLDEFVGLSVRDIAASIALWPDGSEDQLRALAALRARAPGIGHNRPPLEETLDEELAPYRGRQAELLDIAKSAVIIDEESAGKVNDLLVKIRTEEQDIEADRKKRVEPYRQAVNLINARFNALKQPLEAVRQGDNGRGGLRGMLTAWEDKKEAEAEAERQRLREEARQREEAAARARAEAEAKARAGEKGAVAGELEALRAEDEAERLTQSAEAIRPEPTRSQLGQVSRRRDIDFKIEDLRQVLGWLIKQPGLKNNVEQAARTIIGQYLRSIGVDAVERGVQIPGLRVSVVKGAVNVRR